MELLGLVEDPLIWVLVSLVCLAVYHLIPRSRRSMEIKFLFLVLPATCLAYGISIFLKGFLAVPRPCAGAQLCPKDFSFPSGHATVAFAAMSMLGFLSTPLTLLLAAVLAITRVLEGVHTWADVVAGSLLGWTVANIVYLAYRDEFIGGGYGNTHGEGRDPDPRYRRRVPFKRR